MQVELREFPWMEVIGIITFAAGIILIMIRFGLRRPPDLATVDEIHRLTEKFDELKLKVTEWEKEYREECATKGDMNRLGEKVSKVEAFYLTVNDNSIKAMNRSTRALREVKQGQNEMQEIKAALKELTVKVDPMAVQFGRMDENIKLIMQYIRNDPPTRLNGTS